MKTKELIEAVKNERGSAFQNCSGCEYGTHNAEVIEKLTRLAALENAIEDKKLVELHFSIGENVFIIYDNKVKKGVINGIWLQNTALIEIRHSKSKYGWRYAQRLENEIFLTKKEAQKVLNEIIGEE